jgi:hypothetical protein
MTKDPAAAATATPSPHPAAARGAPTTPGATTTPGGTTPSAATTSGATTPVTGLRRGAFLGYRWALLAFLLAGAAQIFLAGLGVFGLFDTGGDTFAPHRTLGFAMAGIAVLILVLALIARPGAHAIVGSAVLVLLTSLVQSLLAGLGKDHAAYGGLHALDGLLILGIAGYLFFWSRRHEP